MKEDKASTWQNTLKSKATSEAKKAAKSAKSLERLLDTIVNDYRKGKLHRASELGAAVLTLRLSYKEQERTERQKAAQSRWELLKRITTVTSSGKASEAASKHQL